MELARFDVTYRLDGASELSSTVGIDLAVGTVFKPTARPGETVDKGRQLGSVRVSPSVLSTLDSEATPGTVNRSRRAALTAREKTLSAPVTGIFRLDSSGAAQIVTSGLDIVVQLTPLQELRYRGLSFTGTASVETVTGQRVVTCSALWLAAPGAPSNSEAPSDAGTRAGAKVRCRLPDDVETAAGLPAVLTLKSPPSSEVIAVPAMYIGLDSTGTNYVVTVLDGATTHEQPVVVGATDGVRRVILSGLTSGQTIVPRTEQ